MLSAPPPGAHTQQGEKFHWILCFAISLFSLIGEFSEFDHSGQVPLIQFGGSFHPVLRYLQNINGKHNIEDSNVGVISITYNIQLQK